MTSNNCFVSAAFFPRPSSASFTWTKTWPDSEHIRLKMCGSKNCLDAIMNAHHVCISSELFVVLQFGELAE